MKKLIQSHIYAFFVLIPFISYSQQIYIGQDANEVGLIISADKASFDRARGSTQVTMQYQSLYNNGKLSEILLCKQNVPMIDLHKTVDFCSHYVIDHEKLSYILVEYNNLSIQALESVMDKSMKKIGDYYFGNSNQYVYFKLMKTGEVVKVYRDISKNPPPENILKQLKSRNQTVNSMPVQLEKNKVSNYIANYVVTFPKGPNDGKGEPIILNIKFYDPFKNTDPSDTIGFIDITGFKNQLIPKEFSLRFDNQSNDSTGTFYSYKIKEDLNHSWMNVFKLKNLSKVDGHLYDIMFSINNKGKKYILYANSSQSVKNVSNPLKLPNPRKVISRKPFIFKTTYSQAQVFNYYKQIGASSELEPNSLYMPLNEGDENSCISIEYKKTKTSSVVEISLQCDL